MPSTNNRLREAIKVILRTAPELGLTQLNTTLFYSDLHALRDLGETITRTEFVVGHTGPKVKSKDFGKPLDLKTAQLSYISPAEVQILEEVAKRRITYETIGVCEGEVIDMLVALQQLTSEDADPWMTAPPTDELYSVMRRGAEDSV